MICRELIKNGSYTNRANLERYNMLHSDGRHLISGWFARAWTMRDCPPEDSFEPFIFTWISFNGWAACVTELDRDRDWLDALMLSQQINDDFNRLVSIESSAVSRYAKEFYDFWPIFKAQEIRRSRVPRHNSNQRQDLIEHYLNSRVRSFEPQCWTRHREEGTPIPLDWPHTIATIYRVRCNLFHGEKAAHSEMDAMIVSSAFRVLVHFLHEAHYIL